MTFSLMLRVWRGLFLLALVAITALALLPKPPAEASLGWDKANHLAAFALLTLLARGGWPQWRWAGLWSGLLSYGVLIECAQHATPHRSAEAADVLADALGIALAQLLCCLLAGAWARWQRRQDAR
jgi:VanZ family protein